VKFSKTVGSTYFKLEQLAPDAPIDVFSCSVAEYDEYLQKDAIRSQTDHIALTWLLRERSTEKQLVCVKTCIGSAARAPGAKFNRIIIFYLFSQIINEPPRGKRASCACGACGGVQFRAAI
jgi:hypothetical protein